jgi:hypothetical protein
MTQDPSLYPDPDDPEGEYDPANPQTPGQGQAPQRTNAEWAALRKEKREREKSDERAANAEKELAFMRAGIDSSTNPMADYFVKGYDGEMTPEAIKAKAIEVGLIAAPAPPEPDPAKQESLRAGERIATGAQGGGSVTPQGVAALDEAYVQGGVESMLQVAREMGIPVQNDQQ